MCNIWKVYLQEIDVLYLDILIYFAKNEFMFSWHSMQE